MGENGAERVVVLTGAGISAESGIATFRGPEGLWENHRLEDVASPEGFARDPKLVHRFYNERRRRLNEVEPNAGHRALARLEKEHRGEVLIVTQNVDDLHERAGTENILHMHGELLQVRCLGCGSVFAWRENVEVETVAPCCRRKGLLRPNIVWFGEVPFFLERIHAALWHCDLFLAVGTSGQVYPAAGFVQQVRAVGKARAVELNLEASAVSHCFAESIYGPASEVVPAFVAALLGDPVKGPASS